MENVDSPHDGQHSAPERVGVPAAFSGRSSPDWELRNPSESFRCCTRVLGVFSTAASHFRRRRITDAEILATNDEWQATRARPVSPGSYASDAYSNWEQGPGDTPSGECPRFRDSGGNSGAGDSRVIGGLIKEVEWRRLPNNLIIETARDQTLMAVVAEAAGPVLVVES